MYLVAHFLLLMRPHPFMLDRGSNLVKALREYDTLLFPSSYEQHFEKSFFQSRNKQNRSNKQKSTQSFASSSTTVDKDEELFIPTVQIKQKKSKKKQQSKTPDDQVRLKFENLPVEAQDIIENIEKCKNLVAYIKNGERFSSIEKVSC